MTGNKDSVSIYPVKRKGKDGVQGYGIAFYYVDLDGRKKRKVFTSKAREGLEEKMGAFLLELDRQKRDVAAAAKGHVALAAAPLQGYVASAAAVPPQGYVAATNGKPPCSKTMAEVIDDYLEMYKPTVGYSTYRTEEFFAKLVKRHVGDVPLVDFTFTRFQMLLNDIVVMDDGSFRAEKTLREVRSFVKKILRHGKRQRWISAEDFDIVTDGIKIPKCAAAYDKNSRFIEYDELAVILRSLQENRKYYLIVRILALTGMRGQELFALEKKDLVRDGHYINVRQALVEQEKKRPGDRNFVIGKTKTAGSARKVPAIDEVFQYFDELEQVMVRSGARSQSARAGNQELVFVDGNGEIVDKRALIRNLNNYVKGRCGRGLGLHSLRHCYMTYLERQKVNMRYIELSVGHVLDGVAEKYYLADSDTYIEVLLPEIEKVQQRINEALANVG